MSPSLAFSGTAATGMADGSRPVFGAWRMPITRLLANAAFTDEQVRELVHAYESVLTELRLVDRSDPVTELVARAILECAKGGEFDRMKLHDCALAAVTNH